MSCKNKYLKKVERITLKDHEAIKFNFIKHIALQCYEMFNEMLEKEDILKTKFLFEDPAFSRLYELALNPKHSDLILYKSNLLIPDFEEQFVFFLKYINQKYPIDQFLLFVQFINTPISDALGYKIRTILPLEKENSPIYFTSKNRSNIEPEIYFCLILKIKN